MTSPLLKRIAIAVPAVRRLAADRDRLAAELDRRDRSAEFPPGHYYSPIPDLAEVRRRADSLFGRPKPDLPGIDLDVDGQLATLERLAAYYPDQPFAPHPTPARRYHFENGFFLYSDALFLSGMMRLAPPRRIVEVGSGYSSAAMLDTNELFLDGRTDFTFIEPYPDRLQSLLRPDDLRAVELRREFVQDVPPAVFEELERDDVLFLDSSHVSKAGSDVNHLFFEVLPRLRPGVLVHVHDVFWPFEYPRRWVEGGRSWNEAYLLRAFLTHNAAFRIVVWNQFLARFFPERLVAAMPLCMKNTGASLWLRRS